MICRMTKGARCTTSVVTGLNTNRAPAGDSAPQIGRWSDNATHRPPPTRHQGVVGVHNKWKTSSWMYYTRRPHRVHPHLTRPAVVACAQPIRVCLRPTNAVVHCLYHLARDGLCARHSTASARCVGSRRPPPTGQQLARSPSWSLRAVWMSRATAAVSGAVRVPAAPGRERR